MSAKVYIPVLVLVGAGVAIAVIDMKSRPVKPQELNPAASVPSKGAGPKPAVPEVPKGTAPEVPKAGDGTPKVEVPVVKATPPASVKPIEDLDITTLDVKISLAQALTLQGRGVVFIDGRKAEPFAAGHLEGALHISTDDLSAGAPAWKDYYQTANLDEPVVVYCDGGDCHESEQLRAMMMQARFKHVFIMEDGYPGWAAAGLPVVKGGG